MLATIMACLPPDKLAVNELAIRSKNGLHSLAELGMGRRYEVTIRYREPSYEQAVGRKVEPYRWTYELVSDGDDDARKRAVGEFRKMERLSSVGWIREIEQIDVIVRP